MLNSFLSSQHIKHDRISTVKYQFSLIKFQFQLKHILNEDYFRLISYFLFKIGEKLKWVSLVPPH